jgi:sugar lactone lactonase YvrE
MGIAADSRGDMWIANSGLISLPCPTANFSLENRGGSLSLLAADGRPRTRRGTTFTGGGLTIPWGIAVDGDDNVWVSNFGQQRISQFCGVARRNCRPGARVGDAISPGGTGYFFDGLTRSTAVEIDPSGNVWATNNWKLLPVQTNPGGYQVVAYVGAAAPLRTPLIGPPVPLMR